MQNKKWKKFNTLTETCYNNMIGNETDRGCWQQAFGLLIEIVLEERQKNPDFASQLEMLDDVTDYKYDIQGWLEDCLDEIDMRGENEVLLKMCDELLQIFNWPGYTGSDIKFRKSAALKTLGRENEAMEFCKDWIQKEPENIVAAVAGVYAFIAVGEFSEAEKLVGRFIFDKSKCTDENDIMFTAASKLYEVTGKGKEKKQIDKAIQQYEEYLEEYFENLEDEEFALGDEGFDREGEELDLFDDDLPFN